MKKIFLFIFLCFSLFFIIDVKAFTTGALYSTNHIGSNNFGTWVQNCSSSGACNKNIQFGNNIPIVCDTEYCFVTFTATYTNGDFNTSQVDSNSLYVYTQIGDTGNPQKWYSCETGGGIATCMVKSGTTIKNMESKWYRFENAVGCMYDANDVIIFNSPVKYEQQLQNIQQQQQQQNQFIQDTNTSGANTGYGSVFNESVADTTGTTALFGVLQNFITNLGSNDTCSSFSIPIPFLNNQNVVLPCMRSVYTQHFGLIYNLVQIILSAIIFYWCVVNVLKLFKETLDPFNYKLEVLDL